MRGKQRGDRVILLISILATSACGGRGAPEAGSPEDVRQPYLELTPTPGSPTGVVLETMDARGYTYARVATEGEELWMAGPAAELEVGDTVYMAGADNMGHFISETVGLRVPEIFFVDVFRSASASDNLFEGTVLETMNVAGYTYVLVGVGEDDAWLRAEGSEEPEVWLAGPETEMAVGDAVAWQGGSLMREFHSRTLDRTFAEIVFVGELRVTH